MEKRSIIKQSGNIKKKLSERFLELGLKYEDICIIANEFDITGIRPETISRYINGKSRGSLTEDAIIFLCVRFGIPISLNVGRPTINKEGKIENVIPTYNEAQAIALAEKFWKRKRSSKKETVNA